MKHHYEGPALIVRKLRVGDMENNTYVLEDPSSHDALLVDGCFEADRILAGLSGANVIGIVQTHGHFDHVQALPALKKTLAVPVHAHPADDYPVPIDDELADGQVVQFGGNAIRVLHTPGHTPGSVCFLTGEHLIAGDTLFPGGPGNTFGSAEAFAQVIGSVRDKLFVLPDSTRVYPGHGDDTSIGAEKPYLDEWIERGW